VTGACVGGAGAVVGNVAALDGVDGASLDTACFGSDLSAMRVDPFSVLAIR